ncbi:MAG TPA: hypothetical protein VJ853_07055 [Thermoanaerobaculia bacterium]|nr:hypothetical protein [Thermoanaerobaculia bacterium]
MSAGPASAGWRWPTKVGPHTFLAALATLFFADVLFLRNNFVFRDLFTYHYPMKRVLHDTILRGEFPWWNPYFASGQPMAANPAYELWYPPQWLMFVGPFDFGFALHIIFHVDLALLGMYAFLRSIPLRVEAALFGAISFGLGGFLIGTITNLPTFFVWSWAGVIGWAVLRMVRGGSMAPAALAMAMPLLVLDPVAVPQLFALVIVGALFVDRRAFPRVFGAILWSGAIAAVCIIPAIDHTRDSVRARGLPYETVVGYSMPPARVAELLDARAFGSDLRTRWLTGLFAPKGTPYLPSIYCGVAVIILAIAGFIARQRGALAVAAICVVSYLLALGDHTPLWRWLYDAGLRSLRYPEKFIAAALVTLIVFAAICADRLDAIRRPAMVTAYSLALVMTLVAALTLGAPWVPSLIFAALVTALWGLVFHRNLALLGLALLFVDVIMYSSRLIPRVPPSFFTPPPIARLLEPGATLFHRGLWTQPQTDSAYERLAGPLSFRNTLRPLTPALWNLRLALEADTDETYLLPTHDLLDAMVRDANAGDTRWAEKFASMANVRYIVDYRPRGTVEHPIVLTRIPNRGRYAGKVLRVSETSSSADLEVDGPSTLIVTITMHKYWHAFIDGEETELRPANIAFQSLPIPAGRHHVALRYRNGKILWSGAISAIALLALLQQGIASARARGRAAPAASPAPIAPV